MDRRVVIRWTISVAAILCPFPAAMRAEDGFASSERPPAASGELIWEALPALPDELGVAGPFVGTHKNALIVAGGANFPKPVWENNKVWRDKIHVLTRTESGYAWFDGGTLPRAIGYGAAVSTKDGVVCIGGNDSETTFSDVFLLAWDSAERKVSLVEYPSLPVRCAYGAAALIGDRIYLAGGQPSAELQSATADTWVLDLSLQGDPKRFEWSKLPPCPGGPRALNMTVAQHNGYDHCIYVMGGRNEDEDGVHFLRDVWEFNPTTNAWRRRRDATQSMMAGVSAPYGQSHIFVLGGDDGARFYETEALRDEHPGFPKEAFAYHTITDTWISMGETPANHVTTPAAVWDGRIVVASGEVRPRVRSAKVWTIAPKQVEHGFGVVNYAVLIGYLASMVAVGLFFASRNKSTDDYFRGGMHIPWWAAGCSIFATMLSSLTFTGIPSKAYAQDWVYAVGNMMIPVVAFAAVYVALPFYRRIDATSAYEYLEKRFSRSVRLFGSASFTLFHIFRMAVVMSLTGLALAVATPLTPSQSVLLMGVLSIVYCTMGGIEAVIWTDTIQTVVLLGGAVLALLLLIGGVEGGWSGLLESANASDKLRVANFHWDFTSAQLALWVVVLGAIGQNVSSYTADQAVVQRYMTTPDQAKAARSIWTNALMSIIATGLFFGMGTALFAFYQSNPQRLDPSVTTDQIFPLFIAREMPVGLAGLIVAGVFSAAQSTVSTSMNSTATTVVTDFLRPLNAFRSDKAYLNAARAITLFMGVLGTAIGLVFVDPDIRSLFDAFLKIVGLFMGVLGGLFVLGALTRRANSFGAMTGALVGAGLVYWMWRYTSVSGYLYTLCGVLCCIVVGYLTSFLAPASSKDLRGLTIFDQNDDPPTKPAP